MRRVFLVLAWLAASGAPFVFAQTPAATLNGSIRGQVLNAVTRAPLGKVDLTLRAIGGNRSGGGSYTAASDSGGGFAFTGMPPGRYLLSGQRRGFLLTQYRGSGSASGGAPLELAAGQDLSGVVLELQPQAVITGRVTDEDGEPIQGVLVQVLSERYWRGRRQPFPAATGQTDDRGEYRIPNLSPGKYLLAASLGRTGATDAGYPALFYPGARDARQATPLRLGAGMELPGLDFQLRKARLYRVSGKVVDAAGAPLKNAFVSVSSGDSFLQGRGGAMQWNTDGAFEVAGLAPGSYNVLVNATDGTQKTTCIQPIEIVEADIRGLVVTAYPGQNLSGSLVLEGGGWTGLETMRISLIPADGAMISTPTATVGEDHGFLLPNVSRARYQLSVYSGQDGAYVSSVRAGGQELPFWNLDFSAGVPPQLQITLDAKGGRISGTVTDQDAPAAGVLVALVPDEPRRAASFLYKTQPTDKNGAFSMRGIAPGEYKLFAWRGVEPGAWEDPEFLKPSESRGVAVKVDRGSQATTSLKLSPSPE